MADKGSEIHYAEMVRRQAAEDVARWRGRMSRPIWEIRGTLGANGTGRWSVWQLVGVFDDEEHARDACKPSRPGAATATNAPETPIEY